MNKNFNLYETFCSSIKRLHKHVDIAVAVSGGADSLALTFLVHKWSIENDVKIIALTVDHGLRQEAAAEAEKVKNWLAIHKIQHQTLKWEGHKKPSNIQAEARDARYNLMAQFCRQNGFKNLLVAHNKEDQAETVLLRLMRGSGVDGLCGMAEEIKFEGIRILRPLLNVPKKYLREFLTDMDQEWIEDPSNKNPIYARVNVRSFIQNSDNADLLVSRLVDTAQNMQRSRLFIEKIVSQKVLELVDIRPEGYCVIDSEKFLQLDEEVAYRILSQLIKNIGGEYYKPRFEKLQNLYTQIRINDFSNGCTLGGCIIYKSQKKNNLGDLVIAREQQDVQADIDIADGEVIWDNRFVCKLSGIETGALKIGALGESGLKIISDIIVNPNLPKRIIYSLPALKSLEKILAVPHIGYYFDEAMKEKLSIDFRLK
jgi:tRNA(Ile)-lysidine synthase